MLTGEREILRICIADIVFSVLDSGDLTPYQGLDAYQAFLSHNSPDLTIDLRRGGIPDDLLEAHECVFNSEAAWGMYKNDGGLLLALGDAVLNGDVYGIARLDLSNGQVTVYNKGDVSDEFLPDPLQFPLGEILLINYLARGLGILTHACGIDDHGKGLLFAGNSTNGKSTMAGLWQDQARILNDDRIAIRQQNGQFRMHGAPWHGDFRNVSGTAAPIDRIFILSHGEKNRIDKLTTQEAAAMLLARSFPPFWDSTGMQFTIDFLAELVESVPCYRLEFVPNTEVIDFVRCET